jgi:hypothetical protein
MTFLNHIVFVFIYFYCIFEQISSNSDLNIHFQKSIFNFGHKAAATNIAF